MPTTPWTAQQLARLDPGPENTLPLIGDAGEPHILPNVDFWDLWPIRTSDGQVAEVCGHSVWAGLSAPAFGHPGDRHDSARIRLVGRGDDRWTDLGPLFPDRATAGSREWAGSTVLDPATNQIDAYYTAAGVRGETARSFRQRIMSASGQLRCTNGVPSVGDWSNHHEVVRADGLIYQPANETLGEPGFIKAFRDPFPFRDPADGRQYLLFTASLAHARTTFNGCIGLACGDEVLDPLVSADGVNNELERPHVVVHDGAHYLFFSTQRRTFASGVTGPTGLYGFVGADLRGPYEPLNGSGLVLQNPPEEPFQAYSWLVLDDLCVTGFVDAFALHGRSPDELQAAGPDEVRAHFGGTITPPVWLALDGPNAQIVKRGEW